MRGVAADEHRSPPQRPRLGVALWLAGAGPSVAAAGFFFRLRPPREPRRVFFFAGAASAPSATASVASSCSSSASRPSTSASASTSTSPSTSAASSSVSTAASGSSVSVAFLARLGARVGFSASLSNVIGSAGASTPFSAVA